MFKIGDYAVCPGDGVGQVTDIVQKDLGSDTKVFYIIKILSNGMNIMVPFDDDKGKIRPIASGEIAEEVFGLLSDHDVLVDNSTWNRRNRDYTNKIKTGSLIEIADVLRSLFLLKINKNLSFGEKKMLDRCKELIAQELALSNGEKIEQINQKIESCFQVANSSAEEA